MNSQADAFNYYIRNLPSVNISPIEFDLTGVFAGYQPCPISHSHEKSALWGPLIRDYFVIYYATKGSGRITLNGTEYAFCENQLFVSFPGITVTEYTERPSPLEYHWIHVKSSFLSIFFRMMGISEKQPFYKGVVSSEFTPIFEKLALLNASCDPTTVFTRISLIVQLLNMLFINAESTSDLSQYNQEQNEYIVQSLRYFEMNLDKASVGEVVKKMGLTRSYFSTMFKKHMHTSPQEYLIRLRMKKACEFLLVPNATIASVANSVGYDQFAFSRIFKKTIGISPAEYQKKNR